MREGVSCASSTPPDALQMLQRCQWRYVCQCLDLHVAEAHDHCMDPLLAVEAKEDGRTARGQRIEILVAQQTAARNADMLAPPARIARTSVLA